MVPSFFVKQKNKLIMKTYFILTALLLFGSYQINAQCCTAPSSKKAIIENSNQEKDKIVKLKITGLTCAGCANHVSSALKNIDGVVEQSVEYPGDIATIKYEASKTNPAAMIKAIGKTGYKAEVINETKSKNKA